MTAISHAFSDTPLSGVLKQVVPGVYWLKMPLPFELDHINLYLLEADSGWSIIDCGLGCEKTQAIWQQIIDQYCHSKPIERVIATHFHPDHLGSAGWLCGKYNAPLLVAEKEYQAASHFMDTQNQSQRIEKLGLHLYQLGTSDQEISAICAATAAFSHVYDPLPSGYIHLRDADKIIIGEHEWQVSSSAGHSPEHCTLYCHELGILLSGDQILPRISSNVSVTLDEPLANPLAGWLEGLNRQRRLPKSTLVLPAHDEPFYGLHPRIDQLEAEHQQMLVKVEQACQKPISVCELAKQVYKRKLNNFTLLLALGEAQAHLHYLQAKGQVECIENKAGVLMYQRCS